MKQALRIGGMSVESAEMKCGSIKVLETSDSAEMDLPIIAINGKEEGPKLLLLSSVHGTELTGIEVIRKIAREEVNPRELHGAIVAIPIANPLAYRECSYRTPFSDYGNLWLSFPGNAKGAITDRIASAISRLILQCNYALDLHGVPLAIPYTFLPSLGSENAKASARKMAEAHGVTILYLNEEYANEKRACLNYASMQGIPSITCEFPEWRTWSERMVGVGVRGVRNVMKSLGMIDGAIDKQDATVIDGPLHTVQLYAERGGVVHPEVKPGTEVKRGSVVVRTFNPWGEEVEVIEAPFDGYVLSYTMYYNQAVATGDPIVFLGHK